MGAMIEGAASLPTEPRGQRESARPIAYIKARTTAVRRVTLSVVHRDGRMHTLATKKLQKISCPPTFKLSSFRHGTSNRILLGLIFFQDYFELLVGRDPYGTDLFMSVHYSSG